ncbi:thioesterase II family protein [Mangrovicoccus algicola]|uniref:Thioesterase n=1 Tax=Mangrovicoccus algicola TaxID=2771008 RepID=A0A8J6YZA7_9RHOB|nr:thioesterase [Mangrovicoccus algicola]MBE3640582.1 thioesterase [Mangrovicoccus algicola]
MRRAGTPRGGVQPRRRRGYDGGHDPKTVPPPAMTDRLPALICLPPAGAGASNFRPWMRRDAAVMAPALPGRDARLREEAPATMTARAACLAAELAPALPPRYGLFGYSMGGTLACLLARELAARGLPGPEVVFVLGALPPDRLADGTRRLDLLERDSAGFWKEIARMGGTPAELLQDAGLRALFEPVLRADFAACAAGRIPPGPPLDCPVEVFAARGDHVVSRDEAQGWARFTRATMRLHPLEGGHMLDRPQLDALLPRLRGLWPVAPAA